MNTPIRLAPAWRPALTSMALIVLVQVGGCCSRKDCDPPSSAAGLREAASAGAGHPLRDDTILGRTRAEDGRYANQMQYARRR